MSVIQPIAFPEGADPAIVDKTKKVVAAIENLRRMAAMGDGFISDDARPDVVADMWTLAELMIELFDGSNLPRLVAAAAVDKAKAAGELPADAPEPDEDEIIDGDFEEIGVSQIQLYVKFTEAYRGLIKSTFMPPERIGRALIEAANKVNDAHDVWERVEEKQAEDDKLMSEQPDEWMKLPQSERIRRWAQSNRTGMSSRFACWHLEDAHGFVMLPSPRDWYGGLPPRPHDPSDFERLVTLFRYVPELRTKFLGPNPLLTQSKAWRTIHVRYPEWEQLCQAKAPNGTWPALYEAMRVLEHDDELDRADRNNADRKVLDGVLEETNKPVAEPSDRQPNVADIDAAFEEELCDE